MNTAFLIDLETQAQMEPVVPMAGKNRHWPFLRRRPQGPL